MKCLGISLHGINALLIGLAMNGQGQEAIGQFNQMTRLNIRPNEVTFLAILTVCAHSGLVDEGRTYFHQMMREPYNLRRLMKEKGIRKAPGSSVIEGNVISIFWMLEDSPCSNFGDRGVWFDKGPEKELEEDKPASSKPNCVVCSSSKSVTDDSSAN
ncbi:hypothetical protein F8388_023442 [Cannabis sativa]|uniref:Pentatricopeptide repeat-containing protein n=1 Tax=Cannabis sativa TaxID=3483 RepID=A0A7J6FKP9_CANSA|nr:hypothetical protein F8388_023442 [Cannabis sativa]